MAHFEPPRQLRVDPGTVCCKTCGRPPKLFGKGGKGGYSGRSCKACEDLTRITEIIRVSPQQMRTARKYWEDKTCEAIRRDKAARDRVI